MSAFLWPCQVALKEAILSTTECAGRIYDTAPQEVAFPWIEIGDSDAVPDDTSDDPRQNASDKGIDETVDIHVWGRAHAGKKEVKLIVDAIVDRLHQSDIAIEGRRSSLTWVRRARVFKEADDVTAHGIVTLNIIHRS